MQVSIAVREEQYDDVDHQMYSSLFGRLKFRDVHLGKKTSYVVDLTLVPTEEERAVVLKFKLQEHVIEDEPLFDEESLRREAAGGPAWIRAAGGGEGAHRTWEEMMAERRAARRQTKLEEYFNNPYSKAFATPVEAHEYVEKLKSEILPSIKRAVDVVKDRPATETFTL